MHGNYEHYGYWKKNGRRQFDEDYLENEFWLSSEDTAFDISLLRHWFANLLVVGAVAFATFTMAFNRKFGCKETLAEGEVVPLHGPVVKRMKR